MLLKKKKKASLYPFITTRFSFPNTSPSSSPSQYKHYYQKVLPNYASQFYDNHQATQQVFPEYTAFLEELSRDDFSNLRQFVPLAERQKEKASQPSLVQEREALKIEMAAFPEQEWTYKDLENPPVC